MRNTPTADWNRLRQTIFGIFYILAFGRIHHNFGKRSRFYRNGGKETRVILIIPQDPLTLHSCCWALEVAGRNDLASIQRESTTLLHFAQGSAWFVGEIATMEDSAHQTIEARQFSRMGKQRAERVNRDGMTDDEESGNAFPN